LLVFLHLYFTR